MIKIASQCYEFQFLWARGYLTLRMATIAEGFVPGFAAAAQSDPIPDLIGDAVGGFY